MCDISLNKVLGLNKNHPNLTLAQVTRFIALTSSLKDDILLVQEAAAPASVPPKILPASVQLFLQNSCNITLACVLDCWKVFKSNIWYGDANKKDDATVFAEYGHPHGLSMYHFLQLRVN